MDSRVTQLIARIEGGEPRAASELLPLVYDELRKLAASVMAREAPGRTLQATALVHEAYLQLVGTDDARAAKWDSRAHFFGAAATAMRRLLVDRARARNAAKRGGDRARIALELADLTVDDPPAELIDLDEALTRFAEHDPLAAKLVELRFFAGLGQVEAAAALGLPTTTADRHWAYARAWLLDALEPASE